MFILKHKYLWSDGAGFEFFYFIIVKLTKTEKKSRSFLNSRHFVTLQNKKKSALSLQSYDHTNKENF